MISWIEEEHESYQDKRFTIQDFCSFKGVYLNRLSQLNRLTQFSEAKLSANFDIAAIVCMLKDSLGLYTESILNNI